MTPRYIIRPEHIRQTPTLLAADLGIETRKWPGFRRRPSFDRDFFMVYPEVQSVDTQNQTVYSSLRNFAASAKPYQRQRLAQMGLPIPQTYLTPADIPNGKTGRFVIRPYHHHGGQGYRVTENPLDFVVGSEYSSELFEKDREYRLLFVKGRLACFWHKRVAEGTPVEAAWGHAHAATFVTIRDFARSRLRHTDAVQRISRTEIAQNAHIVAFDLLYKNRSHDWVVLEANFCPGLITNHAEVAEVIRNA